MEQTLEKPTEKVEEKQPETPSQPEPVKSKEELKHDKIRKMREEEERVSQTIRKATTYDDIMSDSYTEMDSYVDMVGAQISTGCIIEGKGGVGKTYRIIKRLNQKGVDFAYTDSYTTPQAFYIWIYKNRNKTLVVDDVAGFMNNDKVLAFLKGGLWEVNGERIINYMTTKPLRDEYDEPVPSTFEFKGSMIIITNKLNVKNAHVQAVLSRVNHCRVEIPYEELMRILEQIAKGKYEGLNDSEKQEVFDFLKENTSETNKDLNIRTLIKMFQFKVYSKQTKKLDLWKILAKKSLHQDDLLVVIEKLIKDEGLKDEEQKVAKFEELTGRKRSTYFALKSKYFKKKKKEDEEG